MDESTRGVYLRPDVVFEPLIDRWHAHSHLVAPATSALFLARKHLPIMASFLEAPEEHAAAAAEPALRGGPFLAQPAERSPAVRTLFERTRCEQADLLAFAGALAELDALIAEAPEGRSLEPLYARVPTPLRGMVELVQDRAHRPSYRLLEPLLYASSFYKPARQSVALTIVPEQQRSFALSTPRLELPEHVFLELPFQREELDQLARSRTGALPWGAVCELLAPHASASLEPFFSPRAPEAVPLAPPAQPRVRYLGHACLLVESATTTLLFDPIVPAENKQSTLPRISFADLPARLDYVVLTHNHQDHVVLETLLQLRHRIGTVVVPRNARGNLADPSLRLMLGQLGFAHVVELEPFDRLAFDGGSLTSLPFFGEHGDLDIDSKAAHLLNLGGKSLLCAADSNALEPELYRLIAARTARLDALFLGMECAGAPASWLYGPLFARPLARAHDVTRRLDGSNAARAAKIVELLAPRAAYVYAMGAEPWLTFMTSIQYDESSLPIVESNRFVRNCRERGVHAERLYGARMLEL